MTAAKAAKIRFLILPASSSTGWRTEVHVVAGWSHLKSDGFFAELMAKVGNSINRRL
jgi:hypothetical protein